MQGLDSETWESMHNIFDSHASGISAGMLTPRLSIQVGAPVILSEHSESKDLLLAFVCRDGWERMNRLMHAAPTRPASECQPMPH